MKLFLAGGGSGQDSFLLDKRFVESLDQTKPVLYIPIAINTAKYSYSGCLSWIKDNFSALNYDNFVMWTEKELEGKQFEDFDQFGGVYIGGGNTFKLLNDLKTFGTFKILKTLAQNNIPIYGGSAGAILLTSSILNASYLDENKIGLKNFSAMNLTHGFDIWCHYDESMKENLIKFINQYNLEKVLTLPEDTGLLVTDNFIEIIGLGEVILFEKSNQMKVYTNGDKINI